MTGLPSGDVVKFNTSGIASKISSRSSAVSIAPLTALVPTEPPPQALKELLLMAKVLELAQV